MHSWANAGIHAREEKLRDLWEIQENNAGEFKVAHYPIRKSRCSGAALPRAFAGRSKTISFWNADPRRQFHQRIRGLRDPHLRGFWNDGLPLMRVAQRLLVTSSE